MAVCINPNSLYRTASFRGVAFDTLATDDEFGQRGPLHQFPDRPIPYSEFLGRKAHHFKVQGYFRGDDHVSRIKAMISACDIPTPGTLVHPVYGSQLVKVRTLDVKHNIEERMRESVFTLDCEEAGALSYPIGVGAAGAGATRAGRTARTGARRTYDVTFALTQLPTYLVTESVQPIVEAATFIAERFASNVVWTLPVIRAYDELVDLAAAPLTPVRSAAAILDDGIAALTDASVTVAKTQVVLEQIAYFRPKVTSTTSTAPGAAQVNANINAAIVVVRTSAVAELARITLSQNKPFVSYSAALAWLDKMWILLDQELGIAVQRVDPVLYRELKDLRKELAISVHALGPILPTKKIVHVCDTLPSLAAAWRTKRDATKAADIEDSNQHSSTWLMPRVLDVTAY